MIDTARGGGDHSQAEQTMAELKYHKQLRYLFKNYK